MGVLPYCLRVCRWVWARVFLSALVGAECKLLFSSTVYIKLMHSTVGCSAFRFWFSYGECFYSVSINSETNPVLNRHTDMAALIPEPVWPGKKASVW